MFFFPIDFSTARSVFFSRFFFLLLFLPYRNVTIAIPLSPRGGRLGPFISFTFLVVARASSRSRWRARKRTKRGTHSSRRPGPYNTRVHYTTPGTRTRRIFMRKKKKRKKPRIKTYTRSCVCVYERTE